MLQERIRKRREAGFPGKNQGDGDDENKEDENTKSNETKADEPAPDPVRYTQPFVISRWQVYPGPYQPGLRVYSSTGVDVPEWLRHLGKPNPTQVGGKRRKSRSKKRKSKKSRKSRKSRK